MEEKKENSKTRFLEFLREMGISQNKCANMCGWSTGYLNILKSDFGADKLASIMSVFPQLNIRWVISGEGEMFAAPNKGFPQILETENNSTQGGTVITLSEFMEAIEKYTKIITEKEAEINILRQEVEALKKQIEK